MASIWIPTPLHLGLGATQIVLLAITVVVAMPLLSPPRYGAHVDSVVFHERGARVFVSQLVGGGMVGILEISAYSHVVRVPRLATMEFVERTRDVRREGWPD